MARFLSRSDSDRIVAAIAQAEKKTSGEIRVHVTRRKPENLEERAIRRFHLLGMAATKQRNGVLLYIAPRARRFEILGDVAIHDKCGGEFWKEVAAAIEARFRKGEFLEGVLEGIERVGAALARHFPRQRDDRDELSNKVTED
ncbi:MAG: TPM domain-containing protein [Thermoanaerobaculia bacterium]